MENVTLASEGTLAREVHEFFSEFTAITPSKITAMSRIVEDLGIVGDDGDEMMNQFAERFNVNISGFTKWDQFGSEGGPDPVSLIHAVIDLLRNSKRKSSGILSLTVMEFIIAAKLTRWPNSDELLVK
jgi:hypothetical protein